MVGDTVNRYHLGLALHQHGQTFAYAFYVMGACRLCVWPIQAVTNV